MKKWVKALRSGDYKQGKKVLLTNDGKFCCLGVLCDISPKYLGGRWDGTAMFGESLTLASEIMVWSGMSTNAGNLSGQKEGCLSDLNDRDTTFDELATIIENNWEEL